MEATLIRIPELDEHSTCWAVLYKKTKALHGFAFSRETLLKLDSEQFVVLTKHEYLRHLNSLTTTKYAAKNLLEQLEYHDLAKNGHGKHIELAEALRKFLA